VDIRGRVGLASGGASTVVAAGCRAGLDGVVRQAVVAAVVATVVAAILAAVLTTILTAVLAAILTTILTAVLAAILTAVLTTVLATAAEPSTPILSSFEPTGGSVLVDRGRLGSDGQAQEGRHGSLHQHVGRLGERSR
jgi:hypothetical protein